jgi:hypothetical protein
MTSFHAIGFIYTERFVAAFLFWHLLLPQRLEQGTGSSSYWTCILLQSKHSIKIRVHVINQPFHKPSKSN